MQWQVFKLPMEEAWLKTIHPLITDPERPGIFFKGLFDLDKPADTYFDLTNYKKGVAWINGHNLGRYWDIGPQTRLYCPAGWLKKGENEIIVFDLHQTEAKPINGFKSAE
jgi:beta-galactosidase